MFSFSTSLTFPAFIEQVKSGTNNVLNELNLDETKFMTVPHSAILENPGDIAIGVNKVKIKQGLSVFNMFDTALIKYIDDGEIMYILYTTTIQHSIIVQFSEVLFEKLGPGLYDSDKDFSFKETQRVKELAQGTQEEDKSIVNVWQTGKYSVVLQYKIEPPRQFSILITKKVEKSIDRRSRKGTILDLLSLDLNKILITEEVSKEVMFQENGSVNCIDYKFNLNSRMLNVFDTLNIRLFGNERVFTPRTQTHLTFTCSTQADLRTLINFCNNVIKIYGNDANGYLELDITDIDLIERNEYWTGRSWHLNEVHGLYNLENDDEKNVYSITISNSVEENGFTLSFLCYNNLIEYFTAD